MKRSDFLKRFATGLGVLVIAPEILPVIIKEEKPKLSDGFVSKDAFEVGESQKEGVSWVEVDGEYLWYKNSEIEAQKYWDKINELAVFKHRRFS